MEHMEEVEHQEVAEVEHQEEVEVEHHEEVEVLGASNTMEEEV